MTVKIYMTENEQDTYIINVSPIDLNDLEERMLDGDIFDFVIM